MDDMTMEEHHKRARELGRKLTEVVQKNEEHDAGAAEEENVHNPILSPPISRALPTLLAASVALHL